MPDASLPHRLNHLTLRFDEAAQEQAFRDRSLPWLRAQFRLALAIGISLYMLVGVLDAWVVPDDRRLFVWAVRFAAMAFPVAVFAFSFHALFGKYRNGLSALTGFAAGLGLIPVMWTMSHENIAHYFAGLLVVIFWTYLFTGTRFVHALAVNIALLAGYALAFGLLKPVPAPLLGSQAFFLFAGSLIGAAAAYMVELQRRVLFVRGQELDRERQRHLEKSLHDSLTGLPNRDLLEDRIGQAIAQSRRESLKCAGLYLDLDGFKHVNDTYGHEEGDEALKYVSTHLRAIVRESDTLARLGGDEFFVLARNIESAEVAVVLARRMIAAMARSIPLRNGATVTLGASIGICLFPYPECTPHDIIRRADRAMYSVKRAGKSGYAFAN